MTLPPTVRWWALAAIAVGVVPLAWLVLIADGWTVNRLVVSIWTWAWRAGFRSTPEHMDIALNTIMFAPFAMLAGVGLPRVPWWVWAFVGFALSVGIELYQFTIARDASTVDVLTNTAGAFVGAFASKLVNDRLAERRG